MLLKDKLEAAEDQVETLCAELEGLENLEAQSLVRAAEISRALGVESSVAADREAALHQELLQLDELTTSLKARIADTHATEALLQEELSLQNIVRLQHEEIKMAEAQAGRDMLAALQDERSAEYAAQEAALIELQKTLSRVVFSAAALVAAELLAEDEHTTDLGAANAELASLDDDLAAINKDLAATHTERASLFRQRDSLLEIAFAEKAAVATAVEDGAVAQAALLVATSEVRTADLESTSALEKDLTDISDALTQTTREYEGLQESLKLGTAEHRLHTEACIKQHTDAADQIAFLADWVAKEQAAVDFLEQDAAALTAEIAEDKAAYEEESGGIEWRMKMVSEGYAEETAKLEAVQGTVPAELKRVRQEHGDEERRHWVAVVGYQQGQQMNDASADELMVSIAETKAHAEALEAEHEANVAFEDARRKLEAVEADAAEVSMEHAARDAETTQVAVDIIKAKREQVALRAEVAKLRDMYEKRLCGFAEQNGELEQQIGFEGTLQEAQCAEMKDRVMLLEAAIRLCVRGEG